MKLILVALICFQIFSMKTVNSSNVSESELLMARVIFRNGKQPPPGATELKDFLHERLEFNVEPFKGNGLTDEGKVDMYNFGAKIRRWYQSRSQNKADIKNKLDVQSTSYKSCQESAKFVKSGVLGKNFRKNYDEAVQKSSLDDVLKFLYEDDGCKSKHYMNGVPYDPTKLRFVFETRNDLVKKMNITLYPKGPYVHNSPDPHPIKAQHIWKIYEYFEAQRYSKENLPEWLTENMIFDMEESNRLLMKVLFEWGYLKKASGGAVYANTILEDFQNKISNSQSQLPDIKLLCAQEIVVTTAISSLLNSKSKICDKPFEASVVKHGTALITELHKKNSDHFVKVLYWKLDQDEPKQIKYAECNNGECTFNEFQSLFKRSTISEAQLKASTLCKKSDRKI